MTIASENNRHVYSAMYPYRYYYVNCATHKAEMVDFKDGREDVISREDFNLFADFIIEQERKIEEYHSTYDYFDNFAYSVSINYYDEKGNSYDYTYYGGDEFPDELNVLIDKFNELSGEIIFDYPDEVITDFPEFLYDEFGMVTTIYSKQNIADALDYNGYRFYHLMGGTWDLYDFMDRDDFVAMAKAFYRTK